MKKAVCIMLSVVLVVSAATAAVNAEIINKGGMKFVQEAVDRARESGQVFETNRVYMKMPSEWYSEYGVYQGKYYASIYWWEATAAPDEYPGYRMMTDNYQQGVYYADVPDDVSAVVWGNGFRALEPEHFTQKDMETAFTADVNIEGAEPYDYETIPEGTADPYSFDGYIYVIDSAEDSPFSEKIYYTGSWYAYYGEGCYGSYAQNSDHFTSVSDNCLNPDHFDADGNHIGGAHITAPEAPYDPPTNPALDGYYIVREREPDAVRSENKLYPSDEEGEYYKSMVIDRSYRFCIVYYEDGKEIGDCARYPEEGWFNSNGELDDTYAQNHYTLYFCPGDNGGFSIELSPPWDYPIDEPTEAPTQAATEAEGDPEQKSLYKERLKEQYNLDDYDYTDYTDGLMDYQELYYHRDNNGETDWALVYCYCNYSSPMPVTAVIGNRVITSGRWETPFETGFGVYDVGNDVFCDAAAAKVSRLDGFTKAMDEFDFKGLSIERGGLIGDVDGDDEISIVDATILQRCDAGIRDFPEDDEFYLTADFSMHSYSDFNRDGERDIIDVTMIQRYLVGIV